MEGETQKRAPVDSRLILLYFLSLQKLRRQFTVAGNSEGLYEDEFSFRRMVAYQRNRRSRTLRPGREIKPTPGHPLYHAAALARMQPRRVSMSRQDWWRAAASLSKARSATMLLPPEK